jgi:predicted regulator of Ras-like GTPase activity (Roadblock/LC7/MglB family)
MESSRLGAERTCPLARRKEQEAAVTSGMDAAGEEKVSGLNGTVEECKVTFVRAEILLTRDQFSEILVVVW